MFQPHGRGPWGWLLFRNAVGGGLSVVDDDGVFISDDVGAEAVTVGIGGEPDVVGVGSVTGGGFAGFDFSSPLLSLAAAGDPVNQDGFGGEVAEGEGDRLAPAAGFQVFLEGRIEALEEVDFRGVAVGRGVVGAGFLGGEEDGIDDVDDAIFGDDVVGDDLGVVDSEASVLDGDADLVSGEGGGGAGLDGVLGSHFTGDDVVFQDGGKFVSVVGFQEVLEGVFGEFGEGLVGGGKNCKRAITFQGVN